MTEEVEVKIDKELPEETEFETAFEEIAEKKDSVDGADDIDKEIDDPDKTDKTVIKDEGEDAAAKAATEEARIKAEKEKVDPYEGMSEAAKANHVALEEKNKKLSHQISSDSGRVRGFQNKVDSLETEITKIKASSTKDKPSTTQIKDAMMGGSEGWAQFTEDYPDVAKAFDDRMEAAGAAADKALESRIDESLAPIKEKAIKDEETAAATAEAAAEITKQESYNTLAKEYPTWGVEVEKPEFTEWLDKQPPGIQALSKSDDTRDASTLIGRYDEHLVAEGKPSIKSTPEPGVDKEEAAKGKESDDLANRREQQLKDGASVPSKSARVDGAGESMSEFDAAFDVYAKRNDSKRKTA